MLIDPHDRTFSLRQQCRLLGLNRSSWYYRPIGENEENLGLMRLLDEQYTRTPCCVFHAMTAGDFRSRRRTVSGQGGG